MSLRPWLLAWGLIWLDLQHVAEDASFLRSKLALITAGVEHHGTLIGRNAAQIAKGVFHHRLALDGESGPFARGTIDTHAVLQGQMLQVLGSFQGALSLLLRHVVDFVQLLDKALLLSLGQAIEVWVAAQHSFLILHGHVAMIV